METKLTMHLLGLSSVLLFSACAAIPKNIKPVNNFDVDSYAGKWYEIARLDYKFEKDLNNVTASYKLNNNGSIQVLNSGFNYKKGKWQSAKGKAKFRSDNTIAALKVSFFGPFYAGYNVVALDDDYQYALVAGGNLKYLWILSRTTSIPANVKEDFLSKANSAGFDTSKLIWVEHNKKENNR